MDLVFITDGRFVKYKSDIYSINGRLCYPLWKRYLSKFDNIIIMARVFHAINDEIISSDYISSGKKVSFIELPYYIGPKQYLKIRRHYKKKIEQNIISGRSYICRVPSNAGNYAAKILNRRKITYGVEVVGDPWDVFAKGGGFSGLFRPFFRFRGYYSLKKTVKRASAALYVTEMKLQQRYPVAKNIYQVSASDVELKEDRLSKHPHILRHKSTYNIISIGTLEQLYKSPDIVLKALSILKNRNIICNLTWLGDGKYKFAMQDLSIQLDIKNQVSFAGNVSSDKVREYLSLSDIFILVSRTEGLPRAVIEAMAMGLPCIGSSVGGIPELIEKAVIVPANNSLALADKIEYLIKNIDFSNNQASINLEKSKTFVNSILDIRRTSFYSKLIELSK